MSTVTLALLVVVVTTFLVKVILWIVSRYQSQQVLKRYGIPGPKPGFFDGHLLQLRKNRTPHKLIDSWLKKYGNVFGYYLGGEPYIVVNDLDMIKQIMIKDFSIFPNRPDLYMDIKPFDKTMIGLKDQRWKEVRSIISPIFSTSKLKLMKNIFDKKVDILVSNITKKAMKNEMFDIYDDFQALTLAVIADCALAMKTRCQEDPNDQLRHALSDFIRSAHNPAVNCGVMFPFLTKIFAFINNNLTYSSKLNQIVLENLEHVIEQRKKHPELRSMDILQLMLDNSDKGNPNSTNLTQAEIIANAYVSLMAGFETTSTALAYTFYLLVKNPDVQEKLYKEVKNVSDYSYDTVQNLPYLSQILDESMRYYPPVTGFISRVCKQDYQIGHFTFPQGSNILFPIWQLHHDPDYFPDPWKFDPDRFSPENKSSIKNMAYMPFGEGPRNCVGARFALLEAKLAMLRLVKEFKFVPCEKTEEILTLNTPTLVTNPANGVWLRAIPRNTKI